jgi:GDSL-like Lipase/Acylhydrolase family
LSERKSVRLVALGSALLFLGAFAVLSSSRAFRSDVVVGLAVLLLVPAAILMQAASRRVRERKLLSRSARRWIPIGIALVGVGLVGLWALGTKLGYLTGGFGLAGLCLIYLGIGLLLAEVRAEEELTWRPGIWLTAASAVAFALGVVICLALRGEGVWLAVAALLVVPAGLTLLSERVLRSDRSWFRVTALLSPIAVVCAALWLHHGLGLRPTVTGAVVGAAFVLLGAIASSTQADVLLVVTIAALFWAATPVDPAEDEPLSPTAGEATLVALGDSYIAGEGAQEFLKGTNNAGVNECRRASTAYPHVVVAEHRASRMERLEFLACSGAKTKHVLTRPQWRGEPIDDTRRHGNTQREQLRKLLNGARADPKLVVVSIGGNDAGFADIATACLAPGTCVERGQIWLDRLRSVADRVFDTYAAIRADTHGVPVLAVPYPVPISDKKCSYSQLGPDEHRFLNRFVIQLDRAVEDSARRAGVHYLSDMEDALERGKLRICDAEDEQDVGVNFIRVRSVEGVTDQVLKPYTWLHNSFHPNEAGHKAMATALEAWISSSPKPPANPAPQPQRPPFVPASLESALGEVEHPYCRGTATPLPRYCDRTDSDWAITRTVGTAVAATPALLLLVAGWWLWWLPVLRRTRPWFSARGTWLSRKLFGAGEPAANP